MNRKSPAQGAWTRGVHVCTDGTRRAHAQLPRLITWYRARETEYAVVELTRQVGALEVNIRARLNPNFGYANDPPIAAAAD